MRFKSFFRMRTRPVAEPARLSAYSPADRSPRRLVEAGTRISSLHSHIVKIGLYGFSLLAVSAHTKAAPTFPQQTIHSFSPTSGAPGSVVTLYGSGFTGSGSAWVGNAHDAGITIHSDGVATVTVPADASTGAIGLLNQSHAAFSPTAFTVTTGGTSYAQQVISGFSPSSGPAGTVVMVTGSGFTGTNGVWIGNSHNAPATVVSDRQLRVVVPKDASSGQIALLNPWHAAFSPDTFVVSSSTPSGSSSSGSSSGGSSSGSGSSGAKTAGGSGSGNSGGSSSGGTTVASSGSGSSGAGGLSSSSSSGGAGTSETSGLSIHVEGRHFIDGSGKIVQLRGVNFSGFEFVAIQGWDPADPTGAQGGKVDGPNWSAIRSWHANVVRLPLNDASWLGYGCIDSNGVAHNPDPGRNYRSAVATQVEQANKAGLFVILDLHWTAPGIACPMLQTQMADADHSLTFWSSVADEFKGNPAVMFELFNEPYLNMDFNGNPWTYMMRGTGGSFSGFPATSNSGNWQNIRRKWAIASYQQMIDAVRATKATNVVLVGTMQYTQDFSEWLANLPTDPQGQMAAAWHPYPTFDMTWGTAAYAQPNFSPQIWSEVQRILSAGIPVIATETGDRNTRGTVGAPLVSNVTRFADQNGVSVVGWAWDVWGDSDNVLIKDVNGTPTDGYGQVFRNWMVNHAP